MAGRSPLFPSWRYGKRLQWRGYDQWGELEVVRGVLGSELHFASSALQGRINLDQPWRPIAEYAVSMAALAALPDPQQRRREEALPENPAVCLLGLGTGSLAWTYHRLIPQATLVAIELRPAVIKVATELFGLKTLTQLEVIQGDAADKLSLLADHSQTLIAIDLFSAEGMASCLYSSAFWGEVSRVLHPCGAIAVNTWSGDEEAFNQIFNELRSQLCSTGDSLIIDHEGFGNYIILASPRPMNREGSLARARRIDELLSASPPSARSWFGQSRSQQVWESAAEEAGLSGESVYHRLLRAWRRAD